MIAKLIDKIVRLKAPICMGLDPQLSFIPSKLLDINYDKYGYIPKAVSEAILAYNKSLIDATYDIIPAIKPQIAMYEIYGIDGLSAYIDTIRYAKSKDMIVIGDIKRGDIGSTSAAYSSAHIGEVMIKDRPYRAFDEDFVTVNPYLGIDGVKPFIDDCKQYDRGIFILDKTSNPSSGQLQDLDTSDGKIYEKVAHLIDEWGSDLIDGSYSDIGAVVGATYPELFEELRKIMPHTYFLVPGYGAQGATGKDISKAFDKDGLGAIVNSSRGIIAAYKKEEYSKYSEDNYADAARSAAIDMINDINSNR